MREIKFRAWDGGKMLDNPRFEFFNHGRKGRAIMMVNEEENVEIMQYTGLKDKNGKEIYEGDIVLCKAMNESKFVVEYRLAEFVLAEGNFVAPISRLVLFKWSMEIIGNIYENPELLNNK